jgi:hypothetical protein
MSLSHAKWSVQIHVVFIPAQEDNRGQNVAIETPACTFVVRSLPARAARRLTWRNVRESFLEMPMLLGDGELASVFLQFSNALGDAEISDSLSFGFSAIAIALSLSRRFFSLSFDRVRHV